MEANYISTASLRNQPRLEINRLQSELSERTKELATGRVADVGLSLGSDTGRMVALRNEITLMETLMRSNGTAAARLTLIQAGLSDIGENAGEVLEALIALPPGSQAAGCSSWKASPRSPAWRTGSTDRTAAASSSRASTPARRPSPAMKTGRRPPWRPPS